ncbi:MAG: aminoacyl-tRNA hydrolase [Deltaproteobacteria bacterium]|nr:aminoacyl-tRNA hydrolase [Deltaproteobacteria bacterium]
MVFFKKTSHKDTKIILGLGNPGFQYEDTRHNIGFLVAQKISEKYEFGQSKRYKSSQIKTKSLEQSSVVLAWPQTFMNLSGIAAIELCSFYKVDPNCNLLVIQDDLDLPLALLKLNNTMGYSPHKGILSLQEELGVSFSRLRIGIGRPPKTEFPSEITIINYVLEPFLEEEKSPIEAAILKAADVAMVWAEKGLNFAQNLANRKTRSKKITEPHGLV